MENGLLGMLTFIRRWFSLDILEGRSLLLICYVGCSTRVLPSLTMFMRTRGPLCRGEPRHRLKMVRFLLYRRRWVKYMVKASNLDINHQDIPGPICCCCCDWRRDHSSKSAWEGPMAGVSDCRSLGSCLTLDDWASCVRNVSNYRAT